MSLDFLDVLVSGGDSRLGVNESGRNYYGCEPYPRSVFPLGSCTASNISDRGFSAACTLFDEFQTGVDVHEVASMIRMSLKRQARGVPCSVALTPSGTDAEYLVTALLLSTYDKPLLNIVMAPNEVGSGTYEAARGCFFDSTTPFGPTRQVGTSIGGLFSKRLKAVYVPIRHIDGSLRSNRDVEQEVQRLIRNHEGPVLLHVVAHSKTGIESPGQAAVQRLQKIERVHVVLDAAQGRLEFFDQALRNRQFVIFTGSKFFGGPPFCGAVFVPEDFMLPKTLPPELAVFFSRFDVPIHWSSLFESLHPEPNFGLLLRWSAALAEMDAYYELGDALKEAKIVLLMQELEECIVQNESLELLKTVPKESSIFSIRYSERIDLPTLKQVVQQLRNVGCQLGQPVWLGSQTDGFGVLRAAIGAPLVVRAAKDSNTVVEVRYWMNQLFEVLHRTNH